MRACLYAPLRLLKVTRRVFGSARSQKTENHCLEVVRVRAGLDEVGDTDGKKGGLEIAPPSLRGTLAPNLPNEANSFPRGGPWTRRIKSNQGESRQKNFPEQPEE